MRRGQTAIGVILACWCGGCGDDPLPSKASGQGVADATAGDAATGQHDAAQDLAAQDADAGRNSPNDAADSADAADSGVPLPKTATATIGGARPAKVTVPDGWALQDKWPLIVLLHGFSATGGMQDLYLGLSARSTSHGFVAVVPEGTKDKVGQQFWNATAACCNFANIQVDDVAYITSLIDEAIAKLRVDPERVYLVGHSNGAFMALRMACERADRITAVASLAGAMNIDPSKCQPSRPVSVLHIHGTLDNVILFAGGALFGNDYPGAETTVADWVKLDQCPPAPAKQSAASFEDLLLGEETDQTLWQPCGQGTQVEFWKINGALHVPVFNAKFKDELVSQLLARSRTKP